MPAVATGPTSFEHHSSLVEGGNGGGIGDQKSVGNEIGVDWGSGRTLVASADEANRQVSIRLTSCAHVTSMC